MITYIIFWISRDLNLMNYMIIYLFRLWYVWFLYFLKYTIKFTIKLKYTILSIIKDNQNKPLSWWTIWSTYQNGYRWWSFRTFSNIDWKRFLYLDAPRWMSTNNMLIYWIPWEIKNWEWYIVTWIIYKDREKPKIYINWKEIQWSWYIKWIGNYAIETYPWINYNRNWFDIWKVWHNNVQFWNWYLDDVKIYNRALSDQEILQQANIAWF